MGILSFFRRRKPTAPPEHADSAGKPDRIAPETPAPVTTARVTEGHGPVTSVHAAILEPIVTEKASLLGSHGQYTFRVAPEATKQDVRNAVASQYGVHVAGVTMITVPSKVRRRGRTVGAVSGYRKAIVSLQEGEQIDLTKELR